MALMEPGVVHAEDYQYMCSEAGQALIAKAIEEKQLTGLVICSCSTRIVNIVPGFIKTWKRQQKKL